MPKGYEGDGADCRNDQAVAAPEGNVEVADQPLVEPPVPHPPKAFETVVVADASAEVVDDFDAAHHRPQPADPPNQ